MRTLGRVACSVHIGVRSPRSGQRAAGASLLRPSEALLTFERVGLICVAILLIAALYASIAPGTPEAVSTRSVRIAGGDSLWSLARAHPVEGLSTAQTAELIRTLNGLSSPIIHPGQDLLVPTDLPEKPSVASR